MNLYDESKKGESQNRNIKDPSSYERKYEERSLVRVDIKGLVHLITASPVGFCL